MAEACSVVVSSPTAHADATVHPTRGAAWSKARHAPPSSDLRRSRPGDIDAAPGHEGHHHSAEIEAAFRKLVGLVRGLGLIAHLSNQAGFFQAAQSACKNIAREPL